MVDLKKTRNLAAPLFLLGAALACEPEARTPEPGSAPASGMLAVDGQRIVLAAPDHDQLLIIDAATREVTARVDVSDEPSHVVVEGDTALVTTRFGHTVDVVDLDRGELVRSITVGVEPVGLTRLDDQRVAVALAGEDKLAVVNHVTGDVEQTVALDAKDPRGVARLEDGRVFVTHMTAGVMSEVDLEAGRALSHDMTTFNEFGPRVHANLMRSVTVAPDGETLLVAHSQANADTVRAPIGDGFSDPGVGGDCGYSGCASELPANAPAITEVDPGTGAVILPSAPLQPSPNGGAEPMEPGFADCFDCGGFGVPLATNPPNILNPNEVRFGGTPLNNATAIALFDGGRGMLVLNTGSRNVLLLRRTLAGGADDVIGVVNVGHGAQSIGLSADGTRAFVFNQFDGTITEFELPVLSEPMRTQSKLVPSNEGEPVEAEFREVATFAAETWSVVDDPLEPVASRGRKLFHDALDSRISISHSISCATCHPDGRNDNRTWQFTFGPRNTPQLGGGILDTAPFHWPGDVITHRDLNTLTVQAFMGGTGLDNDSMDAIAAFIDTIRSAPSPAALQAGPTDAQLRGQMVFDSPQTRCTECHAGPHYTDNNNWDVGTRSGSQDRSDFQTPVLHGVNRTAPYLHDGSAQTLEELVNGVIRSDRMGQGSHLTDQEASDLVEYLKTL
jgi:DNA-binding beta-propeller fold protein YncE